MSVSAVRVARVLLVLLGLAIYAKLASSSRLTVQRRVQPVQRENIHRLAFLNVPIAQKIRFPRLVAHRNPSACAMQDIRKALAARVMPATMERSRAAMVLTHARLVRREHFHRCAVSTRGK